MQKVLDGLIFIVLCIFLFTGCQKEEDSIHFEEIANALLLPAIPIKSR